jgi:antitoxin component YwqK of YwqJK toxin-antitoxin module
MKYQKLLLSFLAWIIFSTLFSQKLILKETSLLNWNKDQGSLKYTYFEDPKTGNYIPQGKFNYKLDQGTYYKELATGMLKNGKRDGQWNYSISRLDDLAQDVYWTGNIKLTFGYKEGKPDGLWSYVNQRKYRKKSFSRWLPYEYEFAPNETLTVMFANGHPAGTYVYINNSFSYKTKITGQFNAKGFLHGSWVLPNGDEQTEYIFNNGILVKKIIRQMPSGRIISSYIANENEVKLHSAFLAGTLTKSDIEK